MSYFWRVCCELQSFFLFSHCPLSWSKQYWQWRMTLLRPFSLNWETLRKLQVFPVIVPTFFPTPEFYSLSHFLYKLLLQDAGSSQVRCSVPEPSLTNWEDDASWKRKSHSAKQGQTLSRKLCCGWGQQHPTAAWVQEGKNAVRKVLGNIVLIWRISLCLCPKQAIFYRAGIFCFSSTISCYYTQAHPIISMSLKIHLNTEDLESRLS